MPSTPKEAPELGTAEVVEDIKKKWRRMIEDNEGHRIHLERQIAHMETHGFPSEEIENTKKQLRDVEDYAKRLIEGESRVGTSSGLLEDER